MKFSKDGRKAKDPKKTLLRLLSYMKNYIPNLVAVLICIIVSAIASTRGSENIGNLVDEFILPMVASGSTDFAPLAKYLVGIGAIFAAGMIAAFLGFVFCDVCRLWDPDARFITETVIENGVEVENKIPVSTTSGLIPVCVMGVSAVVMVICGLLMRKPKLKWLSEYALPISLILGMAAAIPLTLWLS